MRRKIGYIKLKKRNSEIMKDTARTSHLDLRACYLKEIKEK
jgi:hypothetical protein